MRILFENEHTLVGAFAHAEYVFKRQRNSIQVLREIVIMRVLPAHPNVMRTCGVKSEGGYMIIVMERMTETLRACMRRVSPEERDPQRVTGMLTDILSGLTHLHACGVVHRDIKPENLLCSADNVWRIADFGLSRMLPDAQPRAYTMDVITLWYRAPEVVLHHAYAFGVDVWSLGCVVLELCYDVIPFAAEDNADLERMMRVYSKTMTHDITFALCEPPIDFLRDVFQMRGELRPSAASLLARLCENGLLSESRSSSGETDALRENRSRAPTGSGGALAVSDGAPASEDGDGNF